jgi:hypothetical protein
MEKDRIKLIDTSRDLDLCASQIRQEDIVSGHGDDDRPESRMDLVQVLCQGSMTAAALRMENFPKVDAREDKHKLVSDALTTVLQVKMPAFIKEELKEATEANIGEGWLRKMVNAQCNRWAIDALKMVEKEV